jgi:hypothetical protein
MPTVRCDGWSWRNAGGGDAIYSPQTAIYRLPAAGGWRRQTDETRAAGPAANAGRQPARINPSDAQEIDDPHELLGAMRPGVPLHLYQALIHQALAKRLTSHNRLHPAHYRFSVGWAAV